MQFLGFKRHSKYKYHRKPLHQSNYLLIFAYLWDVNQQFGDKFVFWKLVHTYVFFIFFLTYLDESEIEKLEDAVAKAVRESNFSKAKEIQQKIDKIVMEKTASNQNSLQGEKNFRSPNFSPTYVKKKPKKIKFCFDFEENEKHTGKSFSEVLLFAEHGENTEYKG